MTLDLAQRKKRFVLGFTIALLPVALWTAVPDALFVKIADALKLDERLVFAYSFMLGCGAEILAVYFLNKSYRRPWDWLSATAFITASLSSVATFVFFGAAAAVAMQGW